MVKLTEDMVVARTRVSDMNHVKKLNCWGAELSDISVLRKLKNVEVLSLSVNNISTLADIQFCKNLQELYIRKNRIPDISEICWLRDLPRLRNLWLEENPCAEGDAEMYRQTVIRNIPQLQKLDNTAVTPEEMADAMRRGIELDHPLDGGSDNQSARLQGQGQRQQQFQQHQQQEQQLQQQQQQQQYQQQLQQQEQRQEQESRRQSRNYEQEYEQPQRRESVQTPSRRVSNQVWPEERAAGHHPSHQSYSPAPATHGTRQDDDGYGPTVTEYSRRYGSSYEGSYSRQREATPDDGRRRHSVREESRYQESPPQRPQRSSYSGTPTSDGYYRGQEMGRPVQEYSSPQPSLSRATTPGEAEAGPVSLATQGRKLSRAELTPVRESLALSPLSREGSSLAIEVRTDSPTIPSRDSPRSNRSNASSLTPAQEAPYDVQAIVDHHYEATYRQVDQQLEGAQQLVAQRARSPQRPYPIRPKNRNSNVLSAILCLIKEIDGPSLEVVEMAVRCRMEELED